MTDLIRPPHAITIWASNDILYVELPNAETGEGKSHLVKLPLNVFGLTKCLGILKERSSTSKLSTKGDPTQAQADKAIRDMQRKASEYKGPITKHIQPTMSESLKANVKDVIRRFINV